VCRRLTTICCSAVALSSLAFSPTLAALTPSVRLALFPVATHWSIKLDAGLAAPPAFDADRAFLPLAGGRLAAYDLIQGRELWDVEGTSELAPIAAEGRVIVVDAGALMALDAATGRTLWTTALDPAPSAPVAAGHGWLIVAGATGTIAALRAEDGSRVWTADVAGPIDQGPTIGDDRLYVPVRDGRVVALRLEDGRSAWERRLGGAPQPVLALGERLYVGSDDNFFYCLMTSDGRVAWRWRTGGDIVGVAAADEERVYFLSLDNVLRGLDRGNGAQRWKKALPLRPTSGPLAVAGTLLVSGLAPSIQGYFTKDGAAAGDLATGGLLAAPPHTVEAPLLPAPLVVYVTRPVGAGATMTAVTRSVEPVIAPIAPLPNPVPIGPPPAEKAAASVAPELEPAPAPPESASGGNR
jgi:outer membrane protein assembly factor BamB